MRQDGSSVSSVRGASEEMAWFRYLGLDVAADGTLGAEVSHVMEEVFKVLGTLRTM